MNEIKVTPCCDAGTWWHHIHMVDQALNSHSYKLILSRDISVLNLLWEERAASLNWNEALLTYWPAAWRWYNMAAQGSSMLLSQPHQVIGDPALHLTWAARGTGPRKSKQGQSYVGFSYVCTKKHVTSKSSHSLIHKEAQALFDPVFGLVWFSPIILWEGLWSNGASLS